MVAIRQTVTVGPNGRIEICASDIPAGTSAEVIVVLPDSSTEGHPRPPHAGSNGATALDRLTALQRAMEMDVKSAAAWAERVRSERSASPRPE